MSQNKLVKSRSTSISDSDTVKKVKALLGMIPCKRSAFGTQIFYQFKLITPEGHRITFSMQGSGTHYCEPRVCLPSLLDYKSIEVGIIPDKQLVGWLQPSHIGFTRVKDSENDDVLGFVPVHDLIADLADFFDRGGVIDATQDKEVQKIKEIE